MKPADSADGKWARITSRYLRKLEFASYTLGAALLVLYLAAAAHAALGSQQAVVAFEAASLEQTARPDTSLWAEERIAAWRASLGVEMAPAAGVLRIPALDLSVPIFEGVDELELNRGVGRIPGTAPLGGFGNMGIAGHRDGFFRGLKDVATGDLIEVETADGAVQYSIAGFSIVEPSDVSVLEPTDQPTLTLVTCYPFYYVGHAPKRYIVQAVRVDAVD